MPGGIEMKESMEMELTPKFAKKKIFEGEGGSYHSWSATEFPFLAQAKVGAGILVLKPGGFALPHYADSSKVGYVLQGENGVTGMVLSNDKKHSNQEIVLGLRAGDVIPVPIGAVSWWYNHGKSDLVIVFVGETSKAYVPGEFTYFLLTGAVGILGSFSSQFTSRAYNMNQKGADILAKSQKGSLIIKLGEEERKNIPFPKQDDNCNSWVKNIANLPADFYVEKAGVLTSFTGSNFPFLEEVGLSCKILKLEAKAMLSPTYNADSSFQVFYVVKGSGKVEIVGLNGKLALDTKIESGQLVIVPRCFVVAIIACDQGMECFSITTSTEPSVAELASKHSALNVLSSSAVQLSLDVNEEFLKSFKQKIAKSEVLIPPMS
ncbi:Glutelin type-A 2 [Melia azedarach]|uniref:Glutelin type-A 2 n=1 Tax=Melia azedarach TaxID=155640 RepID=A0ACC1Y3J8_MELAZ|nr:Glutelin type-A 2 [Melia azedarach]